MSVLKIKNGSTWEEIPAGGVGVPSGGTAGQVLMKSSATDYADEWADISEAGAMSQWELLWTNASPSSAFAAQTVSLDLSGYDFVAIVTRYGPSDSETGQWGRAVTILKVGWPTSKMLCYRGDEAVAMGHRCATVSSTGVSFAVGYENSIQSATRAIPTHIYGIKGVNS